MRRIVLVSVGIILISIGAIDWAVGALMSHGRIIIILGASAVAAAGFIHGWQKIQEKNRLPFMALAASPLDQVLTPSDKTPVVQWNPHAVSGSDAWLVVLMVAAILVCWYFFFRQGRRS